MAIDPTALSAFGTTSLPPVSQASLPADVRNGTKAQKQTYMAALGFEQMLVQQLAQSMLSTAGSDGSDGSGGSEGSSGGSDATASLYQQMIPDQLASAVTSAGGTGLADQLYQSLQQGQSAAASASGSLQSPLAAGGSTPPPAAPAASGEPTQKGQP